MRYITQPKLQRLMKRVVKTETCWLWTGARCRQYGAVSVAYGEYLAHRAVWVHSGFELKNDDFLLHSCDNPLCVNPAHLRVGTHRDNMQDMVKKGRWRSEKRRVKTLQNINPT